LKDKIHFEQDRIYWMKFTINISIRAIPIDLETIENNISLMEYSTGLFFRNIQEIYLTNSITQMLLVRIQIKIEKILNQKSKRLYIIKKRNLKQMINLLCLKIKIKLFLLLLLLYSHWNLNILL
jgi:hypothetical protein